LDKVASTEFYKDVQEGEENKEHSSEETQSKKDSLNKNIMKNRKLKLKSESSKDTSALESKNIDGQKTFDLKPTNATEVKTETPTEEQGQAPPVSESVPVSDQKTKTEIDTEPKGPIASF